MMFARLLAEMDGLRPAVIITGFKKKRSNMLVIGLFGLFLDPDCATYGASPEATGDTACCYGAELPYSASNERTIASDAEMRPWLRHKPWELQLCVVFMHAADGDVVVGDSKTSGAPIWTW